ncbi:MAG: class I SAM-dependent methyltransferase [Motilibacteraceae bacterium]
MTAGELLFGAGAVADGYREHLEPVIFRPWADRLVAFAEPRPGQRLLDVASGTGVVARAAAAVLGPEGRVIASDISSGMLAHVPVGYPPGAATLEVLECSATELALPESSVDVVLCQQGLPFIPDRAAAAREMHRVLRPGGTAAVAVWLAGRRLDPMATCADVLLEHGVAEPSPGAWDLQRFCMSPEQVEDVLTSAGFVDVEVRVEELTVSWSSAAAAARGIQGTPFYPVLAAMDPDRRRSVEAALVQRMGGPDGEALPVVMTAVLGRGTAG